MKITSYKHYALPKKSFVIYRETSNYSQYFSFYVDADSSCWTRSITQAAQFATKDEAREGIENLKKRARMRYAARRPARGGLK